MSQSITSEEIKELREFKSEILELYWERFGTFYLHIMPHPLLEIGKRGLVSDEKELGIILVLGPKAVKDYGLDEEFLYCDLQFGYTWEKLKVPWDCIFRIYDKSQNAVTQMRFFTSRLDTETTRNQTENLESDPDRKNESNVIQVDFGGKKKQ